VLCQSCYSLCPGRICARCRADLRPAAERILEGGVRLIAGFEHVGAARELVHAFKYRGFTAYADLVVEMIGPRLPVLPIVPVPRAWTRQVSHGIDPARELGRRLAKFRGVPLCEVLVAPVHSRRRAGGDHSRPPPRFATRAPVPPRFVLVDDVVTTGATVRSAAESLGFGELVLVVAANAADTVSSQQVRPEAD
jgi:predicted amidophosphoribosyltransferase